MGRCSHYLLSVVGCPLSVAQIVQSVLSFACGELVQIVEIVKTLLIAFLALGAFLACLAFPAALRPAP
jgi:hypothetical protein